MPPSGEPVKEDILANLEDTALPLIVAGADYYTTVETITRVDAGPMDVKSFPAIIIVPLNTDYDREGTQGTLTIAAAYRIQLSLFLRTRTDSALKLERFIRDVHKAVLVDRTRNSNALNTRAVSDEVFYQTEDDEPYASANLTIEVDYRTLFDDLNTPT